MTVTRQQAAAYERVGAIKDPIAECKRRWSDFAFTTGIVQEVLNGLPVAFMQVQALWTIRGERHGLRQLLSPKATRKQRAESKRSIAHAALFNDEMRRSR